MKAFKNIFKTFGVALLFASCDKFVEIDPPTNSFVASTAFATDELVEADIAGLYSYNLLSSAYHDTYRHLFLGFSSDELEMYTTTYDEFIYNTITPRNTINRYMWSEPYKAIYQCNLMVESVEKNTTIKAALKEEALGVAKFFRALSYLNLTTAFGDVPLVLVSDVKQSGSMPRTTQKEVYAQVIKDLEEAKVSLRNSAKGNAWLSEAAASALLSRAYLYDSQWQKAAAESDNFVSGSWKGKYSLERIDKVFKRSSVESIFTASSDGSNRLVVNHNFVGRTYIPATAVRAVYYFTDDFMAAFEEGDLRKANWTAQFTARAPYVWYPAKYKLRLPPSNSEDAEDQVFLRLGEVYLNRAEANAQQNKLEDAVADLNAIRKRAGLKELANGLTKDQVLLAVEKERRLELFSEYGHRWADLVRTGRVDAVLGVAKKDTWKSFNKLYPIPEQDIELNPSLTQNPGYNVQ